MFRDSDPTSHDPDAKSSGSVIFTAHIVQIIIIVLHGAPDVFPPAVFLGIMCPLHLFLALLVARTLPYFRPAMNRFRVSNRAYSCERLSFVCCVCPPLRRLVVL